MSLCWAWFKSGYVLPRHSHNADCLYYVLGGSLRLGSVWLKAGPAAEQETIARLAQDLASGAWDARFGHLRTQAFFEGSLRLVVWRR
jgi:hypothetical protein